MRSFIARTTLALVLITVMFSVQQPSVQATRQHCAFRCLNSLRFIALNDAARFQFVLIAGGFEPTDRSMAQALQDEQGIATLTPLNTYVLNLHGQFILNALNAGDVQSAARELQRANDGL